MRQWVNPLAKASCFGMLLVLMMGATVTQTDSGRGCGRDWPLCHGKFIPSYTIESMIEYSHRFVTGVVGIIVLAAFIAVWRHVKRRDARFFVTSTGFFTVLQAVLGALAVVWPQSSAVLALHFGFSLLAFASTLLLVFVLREGNWERADFHSGARALVTSAYRTGVWLTLIYCYGVVYLGAFVRHTKSAGGCTGWPLCNGEVFPELSGATGIVFVHRLGAILLFVLIAWLAIASRGLKEAPHIRKAARWSLLFVVVQVFSGAYLTATLSSDWYLLSSLLHTLIVSCLFGALCYMSVEVLRRR